MESHKEPARNSSLVWGGVVVVVAALALIALFFGMDVGLDAFYLDTERQSLRIIANVSRL